MAKDLERLTAYATASPPATPDGRALLPGEIERGTQAKRLADGIPLDPNTLDQLRGAPRAVGLFEFRDRARHHSHGDDAPDLVVETQPKHMMHASHRRCSRKAAFKHVWMASVGKAAWACCEAGRCCHVSGLT